jgi:hypothetical protein
MSRARLRKSRAERRVSVPARRAPSSIRTALTEGAVTTIPLCLEYRDWLRANCGWRVLDDDLTMLEAIDWIAWGASGGTGDDRSPEIWDEAEKEFVHALASRELTARGLENGAGYPKATPADFWEAWPTLEPLASTATVRRRAHNGDALLVEGRWTQIRVAAHDVLALWPVPLAARLTKTKPASPADIERWYREYVKSGAPISDWAEAAAAEKHFGRRVPRERCREIRKKVLKDLRPELFDDNGKLRTGPRPK